MAFLIKLTAIRANTGTEICCDAVHPEQLDTGLPSRREKLLRIARIVLPPVCVFAAIMAAGWAVDRRHGLALAGGAGIRRGTAGALL